MQVILAIVAAIIVIAIIVTYKWFFIGLAVVGIGSYIGYRVYKAKKAKKTAETEPAPAEETAPAPTDRITSYELKGVFKCEKEIFRALMEENPEYNCTKRELIDCCAIGYPVYKWVPKALPAKLVPEPENPYDPNAIKVLVGDTMIGYIPKGKTEKVRKVLDEGRLLNVAYEITGGKYKLITEDYDPDKDKSTYDLESGYEEIAAKVYIKENL